MLAQLSSVREIFNCKVRGTRLAFLATRLLGTPCWCLLAILFLILHKDLHCGPWELTALFTLKPMSALLSPYWNELMRRKKEHLVTHLILANLLRHLPFLFVPWINSTWVLILAFGWYMTLTRASLPSWLEIFKQNLPKGKQEKLVSYGTLFEYIGDAVVTILLTLVLDAWADGWRILFPCTALLGILATPLIARIKPTPSETVDEKIREPREVSTLTVELKEKIIRPWKQIGQLFITNRSFALFQIGFMFGGSGLMILYPVYPHFFVDTLNLSYTEMGLALSFCKGLGVLISNHFWTQLFRKVNIFQMSALVLFFATLFPLVLLSASLHLSLLYIAFILYGVMQSGSQLSWHMSGLVFAKDKESSIFTITNVLAVGLRGTVVPAIGSLLLVYLSAVNVMLIGAVLCLIGGVHFLLTMKSFYVESTAEDGAA